MAPNYRILVLGKPGATLPPDIERSLLRMAAEFGLTRGDELEIVADTAVPSTAIATVAVFLGSTPTPAFSGEWLMRLGVPVIPVVTRITNAGAELPASIGHLNAMATSGANSADAIAAAMLECLGLLPKQRRVFVSYVRKEATPIALQLFAELGKRQFQVFIDTHDIRPGEDFQAALWHKLCDSDVMIMIDSKGYFDSRWTREEFGRAAVKKASILRLGMPGVVPSASVSVTQSFDLDSSEITTTRRLRAAVLDRVCDEVERLRSESIAVRHANLVGSVTRAIADLKGLTLASGSLRSVEVKLPRGRDIRIYTALGVPTAQVLNDIAEHAQKKDAAIVYDQLGIHTQWLRHKQWLADHVPEVRWIPAHEAGWLLSGWNAE